MREIDKIYHSSWDASSFAQKRFVDPIVFPPEGKRSDSASVVGANLGDEGKGGVVDRLNGGFAKKHGQFVSLRVNGSGNTGHEVWFEKEQRFSFHQLPEAVIFREATGVITRGMLIHPEDLVREIDQLEKLFGEMPGRLLIDPNVPLCLDTEKAWEAALKKYHSGIAGSTGRGVAPGYAEKMLRIGLTMRD